MRISPALAGYLPKKTTRLNWLFGRVRQATHTKASRGFITAQWDQPDSDEIAYVNSLRQELIAAREGKP
jgi:hypothetical protein